MAETVIVMTLMLLVVFGIMYCGRALYTYHAVANAARLGARFAIVRGTQCTVTGCPASDSDVRDYVRAQSPLLDSSSTTVTLQSFTGAPGCATSTTSQVGDPGCLAEVTVSYPFQWQLPLIPAPPITMSSTSQMVISQ